MRIVIIGGGILGASVAWHLAEQGLRATVIEAGPVAGQATGRGFGWINASFYHDEAHFQLRLAGIKAWKRVEANLNSGAVTWPGCVNWEWGDEALEQQFATFRSLDYPVEIKDKKRILNRLSGVANLPGRALYFPGEGALDGVAMARAMLRAARARVIAGTKVTAIEETAGRVTAVRLAEGRIPADAVVVAAGVASGALVAPLGVHVPLLDRPGLMLRTRPVAPVLPHILAGPTQELRQDREGRILAPTAANHQGDAAEAVEVRPDILADRALARVQRLLPDVALEWEEVTMAWRPVPQDGLPVMGPCAVAGLHLAVMHSGATLGAIAGAMVAEGVMGRMPERMMRYDVARFHGDGGVNPALR